MPFVYKVKATVILLLLVPLIMGAGSQNQVMGHASPYLAMHGQDPVNWQLWDRQVLRRAVDENKMIYLSVGYFSCYWCHVMQKESFQDPEIATILNKYFIPVIVDRELDPALDTRMLEFVELYRGVAGWPLNVILTPEGYPVLGGVYIPQAQFKDLLMKLVQRWQVDESELRKVAREAAIGQRTLGGLKPPPLTAEAVRDLQGRLLQHTFQFADEMSGGFGDQTKFPMVPQLQAMLSLYQHFPTPRLLEFLRLTLDQMAAQGLYDHLAGGFFRYTTDPAWQVPHFEKMLYDNAQLAILYLQAARLLDHLPYEQVARDTLDFLIAQMRSPEGGFYAALSALDDKGVEGGYYLWTAQELDSVLGKEQSEFARFAFRMGSVPALEQGFLPLAHHDIPFIASEKNLDAGAVQNRLLGIKRRLLKSRLTRTLPVDTKVLAAWNGLALDALSQAAALPAGEAYGQAAKALRDYMVNQLWRDDVLYRMVPKGQPAVPAGLDDYAYAAKGLLSYAQVTGSATADRKLVRQMVDKAWATFSTDMGWFLADEALLPIMHGRKMIADDVLPSPSRVLIAVSLQLADLAADKKLSDRALAQLVIDRGKMAAEPFSYAGYITLLAQHQDKVLQ